MPGSCNLIGQDLFRRVDVSIHEVEKFPTPQLLGLLIQLKAQVPYLPYP